MSSETEGMDRGLRILRLTLHKSISFNLWIPAGRHVNWFQDDMVYDVLIIETLCEEAG